MGAPVQCNLATVTVEEITLLGGNATKVIFNGNTYMYTHLGKTAESPTILTHGSFMDYDGGYRVVVPIIMLVCTNLLKYNT